VVGGGGTITQYNEEAKLTIYSQSDFSELTSFNLHWKAEGGKIGNSEEKTYKILN